MQNALVGMSNGRLALEFSDTDIEWQKAVDVAKQLGAEVHWCKGATPLTPPLPPSTPPPSSRSGCSSPARGSRRSPRGSCAGCGDKVRFGGTGQRRKGCVRKQCVGPGGAEAVGGPQAGQAV